MSEMYDKKSPHFVTVANWHASCISIGEHANRSKAFGTQAARRGSKNNHSKFNQKLKNGGKIYDTHA